MNIFNNINYSSECSSSDNKTECLVCPSSRILIDG